MSEPTDTPRPVPPSITAAWIGLMRAQRIVLAAIEADLKAAGLPPLGWYDVLLELARATEGRLRPFEIEKRTLLTQYNLSRLIDRLEGKGLVQKELSGEDGRGRLVVITQDGRAMQARMWTVYSRALSDHVGRKLDESGADALAGLLAKLTD
ncbi:MarR family transcriptional regulator [Methylobacterium sp. J-072]|uniref:MarR family winged helix-turn-helix transcriptional regulator n=1 Tax=Methylobacterium sp. J-072 TaxID=2836651 RepID=UPI001FB8703E|nr:MarR family winged helix-turn-helix transcriptional regulator [Methylobacterium sp. J-072]MCJ2095245.1 MarR family transcriptional regulator [Methylobacterium sp. J-072]